jgi:membrane protein DedA with SNARE-associated domain/rhodanese-related sulfurtransferase
MIDARHFLMKHGAPVLFGAVFVEQIGMPLPAVPWMLAVGALAAAGGFSPVKGILATMVACVLADALWFYLGRFRGVKVLNTLCRISLEPDSCVRRMQNVFTKYGWRGIVVAKFLPGLSTMAPPMAGMSSLGAPRFFLADSAGSLLYGGCFIYLGYFFSNQIDQIEGALASIGASALSLIVGVIAAWVGYKYWQRKRLLHELRMARITVAELRKLQDSGDNPVILDLRSTAELHRDPELIKGAVHLTLDDVHERRYKIPPDSEVVVYCSCPNEVTAARVTLMLRKQGFTRVRPLLGGLDAWRDGKFPLSTFTVEKPEPKIMEGRAQT